jgi:excisionase family DNA binding protein
MMQDEGPDKDFNPYVDDPLLKVEEAATYCGVKKSTVQKWRREGLLPCVRVCADVRFRRSDLNKFINSRRTFGWMKGI